MVSAKRQLTGIVQVDALESWRDDLESDDRQSASDRSNGQGSVGLDHHVGHCANGNASGQRGILDVNHVESLLAEQHGKDERGYGGADDGEEGVDDGSGLTLVFGNSRVERWLKMRTRVEHLEPLGPGLERRSEVLPSRATRRGFL